MCVAAAGGIPQQAAPVSTGIEHERGARRRRHAPPCSSVSSFPTPFRTTGGSCSKCTTSRVPGDVLVVHAVTGTGTLVVGD